MDLYEFRFVDRISQIGQTTWNALAGTDYPFLRYEYLHALEASWSVYSRSGWKPCHLEVRRGQELLALLPLYEKSHSWGEYVFDWAWAEAYQQTGLSYYPKLLSAVPFTPCEGPRLLMKQEDPELVSAIVQAVQGRAAEHQCSSWHLLFPDQTTQGLLEPVLSLKRLGVQFHWQNPGYSSFTEFLGSFTSRKRKNVRKERESVRAQGITFQWLEGGEIPPAILDQFYVFYQATYLKRGQRGYLTRDFFVRLIRDMPEQVLLIIAEREGRMVAAAWFLKNATRLYGRYWGCLQEYNHLHFETCYYQGIDYCIAHGLKDFDAGAQGEHKLLRGFEPRYTCSYHWLADERFVGPVGDFLRQEKRYMESYMAEAASLLPYRMES